VNVNQDNQNCGMCGKSCAGFEICNGGTCVGTTPADAGAPTDAGAGGWKEDRGVSPACGRGRRAQAV